MRLLVGEEEEEEEEEKREKSREVAFLQQNFSAASDQ